MPDEKDLELEKAKAAAAAKAKAAAAAKAKAAAAAKAKAAAAAKAEEFAEGTEGIKPKEPVAPNTEDTNTDADMDAKAKAAAAAKAKAAAAAKAKAAAAAKAGALAEGGAPAAEGADSEADAKAKAIAAAKAKAAAIAAAKAKSAAGGSPAEEITQTVDQEQEKPSKNRPFLDLIVKRITEAVGEGAIEQAKINFLSKEMPTLYIKKEKWFEIAKLLREDPELSFDYLLDLHGIDFETHMEVYYAIQSMKHQNLAAFHVRTERDGGKIPSVTPIWPGADWQEREVYDLFGITFEGHPNMTRILLPDHWVGHPLRKDYEPFDEEV